MRFYLISDNLDTQTGMRLAGVEGELVHEKAETEAALNKAINDETIGIILITPKPAAMCSDLIAALKRTHQRTLVVEIPDRHGMNGGADALTRYVSEALGIQV